MSDSPSEAWYRDAVFESPWPLARAMLSPDTVKLYRSIHRYKEYATAAGPIDLLLALPPIKYEFTDGETSVDHGYLIVAEFKRDLADEGAIAQCLRYMAALRTLRPTFPEGRGYSIVGCVTALRFSPQAIHAAFMAGIKLLPLHPVIEFGKAPDLPAPLPHADLAELINVVPVNEPFHDEAIPDDTPPDPVPPDPEEMDGEDLPPRFSPDDPPPAPSSEKLECLGSALSTLTLGPMNGSAN